MEYVYIIQVKELGKIPENMKKSVFKFTNFVKFMKICIINISMADDSVKIYVVQSIMTKSAEIAFSRQIYEAICTTIV